MIDPLFSVIIPTYNREKYLARSIASVLHQSIQDHELIIVDDGSTDRTKEILENVRDPRLRVIYQQNSGRSFARNAGLKMSRGQYITFLDSDDEVSSDWLSSFVEKLQNPRVGVVCCGYEQITVGDKTRQVLPHDRGPVYCNQECLFMAGTFAVRKELLVTIGGYSPNLNFAENTELAMRLVPYCMEIGCEIAVVKQAKLKYYSNGSKIPSDETEYKLLLHSAQFVLKNHGNRIRQVSPRNYANYCAIAGVNSARLGYFREARNYFSSAIENRRSGAMNYCRWILTFFPQFARKVWIKKVQQSLT